MGYWNDRLRRAADTWDGMGRQEQWSAWDRIGYDKLPQSVLKDMDDYHQRYYGGQLHHATPERTLLEVLHATHPEYIEKLGLQFDPTPPLDLDIPI